VDVVKLVEKVSILPVITKLDLSTERVLNAAINANLESCVIVGFDAKGELYFASTKAGGGDVLWMFEKAKSALMDIGA
jgi:hypothetical protein